MSNSIGNNENFLERELSVSLETADRFITSLPENSELLFEPPVREKDHIIFTIKKRKAKKSPKEYRDFLDFLYEEDIREPDEPDNLIGTLDLKKCGEYKTHLIIYPFPWSDDSAKQENREILNNLLDEY